MGPTGAQESRRLVTKAGRQTYGPPTGQPAIKMEQTRLGAAGAMPMAPPEWTMERVCPNQLGLAVEQLEGRPQQVPQLAKQTFATTATPSIAQGATSDHWQGLKEIQAESTWGTPRVAKGVPVKGNHRGQSSSSKGKCKDKIPQHQPALRAQGPSRQHSKRKKARANARDRKEKGRMRKGEGKGEQDKAIAPSPDRHRRDRSDSSPTRDPGPLLETLMPDDSWADDLCWERLRSAPLGEVATAPPRHHWKVRGLLGHPPQTSHNWGEASHRGPPYKPCRPHPWQAARARCQSAPT